MDRENFYILLGLAFDPAVTEPAAIKAAIHRRRQEWTRLQDTPGRRGVALYYLGLIPDIEKVMLDTHQRNREAQAARALRDRMLRQFEAELRILESKGYVTPREATTLTTKYAVYGISRQAFRSLSQAPVADSLPEDKKKHAEEDEGEVLDRITAKAIRRNLKLLGHEDLYAFLELPAYASIPKLQAAAEEKRRAAAASGAKTAEVTAIQELAGICRSLFENFDTKQKYERYLKISRFPALGELIDEEFNRSKYIRPEMLLRFANFAVEKYGCKVLEAEEYIRRYCRAYNIPIDHKSSQIRCPACRNQTSREDNVCTVCGQPLRGECPMCGTEFADGPAVCGKCGFSLAEMVKALRYIGEAENALIESNWSSGQRGLQYARKYWPGHPRIEILERRAKRLEERYASYVENITDCIKHNQYYAARELIQEAAGRQMRLPAAAVEHVEKTIAGFEKKLNELQSRTQTPDFDTVYSMLSTVSDSIELGRLLVRHQPEPPRRVSAMIQGRKVRVAWEKSPSPGMLSYVLVRKAGGQSLTAYDGDILYEGPGNFFEDTTAKQLTEYTYSVFTKRGSAFSESAAVGKNTVLIVPEVENLRILPTDSGARLSWDFNPDIREVMIWRKLGGEPPTAPEDGIRLETSRLDGYADTKIKNNVEYWYFLIAVYMINGEKIYSKGVRGNVTPHKLLAPIEQLDIAKVDGSDDEYVVNWHNTRYTDVLLLASTEKPEFRPGDMFAVTDLLSRFRKLDLEAKTASTARFKCSFDGGLYIFAAAVSGIFASVGAPKYLTYVADVEGVTWDIIAGRLYLNMDWPEDLEEVAVSWRFDNHPATPEEPGTNTITCTRRQYKAKGAIEIADPVQETYYFGVFAVFNAPDGSKVYSGGVRMKVDNRPLQDVFYNLKYTRSLFSSTYTVTLTISSGEEFVLPKCVIIGKVGRLPLKRSDGMPIFEIDKEVKVGGSITYEYRTSLLPKDLYVRLFMRDDNLYGQYRLVPLSNMKIT